MVTTGPSMAPARLKVSWLIWSLALLVVSLLLGVFIGPADLAPNEIFCSFGDLIPGVDLDCGLTPRQTDILLVVRLPRVVLAALVGATLSLAGAAYQGVFRNPLADPFLLGVAAGAGLGATVAIVLGSVPLVPAAFAGAIVAVALSYLLGSANRSRSTTSLILAGVAVAAFLTAIQTYVQQRNDDTLRQVYSWILGRLATSGWSEILRLLPYALVGGIVILLYRRVLDVMAVGDEEAVSLGVNVERSRLILVLAATLATAAAVSVSGLIGFVGIIVPHTVRLLTGVSHRSLLPLSAIAGAAFLILADLGARNALAPAELPIGVVTAALGAPFFAVILRTSGRAL